MNVGIDIDGVIYPWHDSIEMYFRIYKGFTGTDKEFWEMFSKLSPESRKYYVSIPLCYQNCIPSRNTLEALDEISKVATIYYITARHTDLRRITENFFDKYNLPFKENLIFSDDKATYARRLNLKYFVDDSVKNIDSLPTTTKAILFKATHNTAQRDGYTAVGSLYEFLHMLTRDINKEKRDKIIREFGYF